MTVLPSLATGDPVTVSWRGRSRYGVVTGDPYAGVGASFVPVFLDDDGETYNVDARVVTFGYHADATECVGFADCPCARCRHTRREVTASHPNHTRPDAASYCGACA